MLADDMLQVESRAARICVGTTSTRCLLGRIRIPMLKTSRPALALLAAGCSLLLFVDGLAAQSGAGAKKNTKRSQPVQPVQAVDDESDLEAPPPRVKSPGNGSTKNANNGAKRKPLPRTDDESGGVPTTTAPRQPRPEIQPDRVEKLSPELETLLKDWEVQSSKFKKLVGDFKRFKYDYTFSVESRATGKFAYEAPDKGYYQFEGTEIRKGEKSRKKYKDKDGQLVPFDLKADLTEHWVCDGEHVIKINDREKQYERVPIPLENQGQNIIDGPLPFLFGMKVDRAKRRYTFELLEPKDGFKDTVWLLVKPKLMMDASNWSEARVGIHQKTFLPVAVMLTDPSGNSETVHVFQDVEANPKAGILPALFGGGNPFQPNLKNFKLVQNEKAGEAPAGEVPGVSTRPPAGTGTKSRSSANDPKDRALQRSADASAGGTKATKKPSSK